MHDRKVSTLHCLAVTILERTIRASTVLEQDHFYSDFLLSQTTVSTNFNHLEDEARHSLDRREYSCLWHAVLVTFNLPWMFDWEAVNFYRNIFTRFFSRIENIINVYKVFFVQKQQIIIFKVLTFNKLTWLALDEDQAARSRKVEQLIALWGL